MRLTKTQLFVMRYLNEVEAFGYFYKTLYHLYSGVLFLYRLGILFTLRSGIIETIDFCCLVILAASLLFILGDERVLP